MTRKTTTAPTADTASSVAPEWDGQRTKRRVILLADDVAHIVRVTEAGGEYDLRTLLWMVFSGEWAGTPRTLTVEATLGGIADRIRIPPASASTRTTNVLRTIRRLQGRGLVQDLSERGKRTLVRVMSLDGKGEHFRYVDPKAPRVRKVVVLGELLTKGWLTALSKHALALYLISGAEETNQFKEFREKDWMWRMTRDELQAKYGMHNDAVTRAKKELAGYGLLTFGFELADLKSARQAHVVSQSYRHDARDHEVLRQHTPETAPRWTIEYENVPVVKRRANVFRSLRQPIFKPVEQKVLPIRLRRPTSRRGTGMT